MACSIDSDPLARGVRRVTTGVIGLGKALIVRDEWVQGHSRGLGVWGADTPPIAADSGSPPTGGWCPPPGAR